MEQSITDMIEQMARSQEELAHMLSASRDIAVHMTYLIEDIPDENMSFLSGGRESFMEHVGELNGSVSAYLNSISELEDTLGDTLKIVMKQIEEVLDEE